MCWLTGCAQSSNQLRCITWKQQETHQHVEQRAECGCPLLHWPDMWTDNATKRSSAQKIHNTVKCAGWQIVHKKSNPFKLHHVKTGGDPPTEFKCWTDSWNKMPCVTQPTWCGLTCWHARLLDMFGHGEAWENGGVSHGVDEGPQLLRVRSLQISFKASSGCPFITRPSAVKPKVAGQGRNPRAFISFHRTHNQSTPPICPEDLNRVPKMGAKTFDDMQDKRYSKCDRGSTGFNLGRPRTHESEASLTIVSSTRSKPRLTPPRGVCAVRHFNKMAPDTAYAARFADFKGSRAFHAPTLSIPRTRSSKSSLNRSPFLQNTKLPKNANDGSKGSWHHRHAEWACPGQANDRWHA